MKTMHFRAVARCEFHDKLLFLNRKDAKAAARRHYSNHKSVFPCTQQEITMYHIGELSKEVINGTYDRGHFYRLAP